MRPTEHYSAMAFAFPGPAPRLAKYDSKYPHIKRCVTCASSVNRFPSIYMECSAFRFRWHIRHSRYFATYGETSICCYAAYTQLTHLYFECVKESWVYGQYNLVKFSQAQDVRGINVCRRSVPSILINHQQNFVFLGNSLFDWMVDKNNMYPSTNISVTTNVSFYSNDKCKQCSYLIGTGFCTTSFHQQRSERERVFA